MGPSFVQKNEDFTADRAPFQLVGHQSAQSIEAFAHITRFVVKDRKSTRLNSSHVRISYAVFCLKKKNNLLRRIRPSHENSVPPTRTNAVLTCVRSANHSQALSTSSHLNYKPQLANEAIVETSHS